MKIKNIFLLSMLSLLLVACGDSKASIIKDSMELNKELLVILKTVKDDASATKAIAKIEELAPDYKELKERADKIVESEEEPSGPDDLKKEIGEELYDEMLKQSTDMASEMTRITSVISVDKLAELGVAMEKASIGK